MSTRKRLIIDANVLRSAGGENATHPTSKHCREILEAVLSICHKACISADLEVEWDKHQSKYAKIWRTAMTSRRKLIRINLLPREELLQQIVAFYQDLETSQIILAVEKDFHLVAAAIETDWIIISLDNKMRDILANICDHTPPLTRIMWVDPNEADIIDWLRQGASIDKNRQLIAFKTIEL